MRPADDRCGEPQAPPRDPGTTPSADLPHVLPPSCHHLMAYARMVVGIRLAEPRQMPAPAQTNPTRCHRALPAPSFPITTVIPAAALGFDRPPANSPRACLTCVLLRSDFLGAAAIAACNLLSRFAEELVIWSSNECRLNQYRVDRCFRCFTQKITPASRSVRETQNAMQPSSFPRPSGPMNGSPLVAPADG